MKLISLSLFILINISYSKGQSFILADSIIQKNSLQETVFFLSQDSLKGRFTGSGGGEGSRRIYCC
ncbi:MAG: hypothetical protein IPJ81_02365 [Chitinophagaceae bacterium]|nr:hypothetical protein [Chitinophagaceae bacterium]